MSNNMAQQLIEQTVVSLARQMEKQVDAEINKLDNLGDDDIEAIRQKRMRELQVRQEKMKEWAARGHGEYREIFSEQDFFKEMKGEERMICHFFRENWPCKVTGADLSCRPRWPFSVGSRLDCTHTRPCYAAFPTAGDGQASRHPR